MAAEEGSSTLLPSLQESRRINTSTERSSSGTGSFSSGSEGSRSESDDSTDDSGSDVDDSYDEEEEEIETDSMVFCSLTQRSLWYSPAFNAGS